MGILSSLNHQQKEAVGILQIGTFLEYFDLLLYTHMAVVLNEVFFSNSDLLINRVILVSGYCATFVFRPIGAIIFGYMGDTMGRKPTVITTTMLTAITSIVMATLPSYAKIGVVASWVVMICRMVQGMSSMGEVFGAEIYLTELIKSKSRYAVVSLMECASVFGGVIALLVACGTFSIGMDWRVAFWIGGLVALAGMTARTALRETPDFLLAKNDFLNGVNNINIELQKPIEKINKKSMVAYFFIQCGYPLFFYFTYIYCGEILKVRFNYTSAEIIKHNLIVAIVEFIVITFLTYLSCKIYPLKIIKVRMWVFSVFSIFTPYLLLNITLPIQLMLIQLFLCCFTLSVVPGSIIFFEHFPVLRRFTCASLIFACSRALMSIIASFGLMYLTQYFGYKGLLIMFIPIFIAFMFGIYHFEKLEKSCGNYY